jgi:hypothetical protein
MNTQANSSDYFAQRIQALTKSDLIALRRDFGIPLSEAGGAALAAFYKVFNQDEKKEEAAFLAACAIAYILHYNENNKGGAPLWKCFKDAGVSESRVKTLISNKFVDKDGFFHSKYSRLVRYVAGKGFFPDIHEINSSLTDWWKYRVKFIKEYFNEENKSK